ncbi:hypothetical protein [Empedobacter tilapiae]|uniref:Tetratricopeptide repeat protein n=1 Tax=Empedobacter tilapiae TaxID=2491114 RepID=A0A4Z1B7V7_9FLAO|nr:hypothetical protein [Empedobacter tilapiae]TGN24314.1 hypothetical protein E4J94_13810 [Empedobacter tilapiae]
MKTILLITLMISSLVINAQEYSFAKDFVTGKVTLNDLSELNGELKWTPSHDSDLKFRKTKDDKVTKYNPNEIIGFTVDKMSFVSLKNLIVCSDNYALIGQTTKIKESFAQVVSKGKFNIYLITLAGYNPISRAPEDYLNFIFQDATNEKNNLIAYSYLIRMKEKKYEKAKADLYILFKDYPEVIEKIKSFNKENSFLELIEMISKI